MNDINLFLFRTINDLGFDLTFLNPIAFFLAEYALFVLALWMIAKWIFTKEKIRTRLVLAGAILSFLCGEVLAKGIGHFISHPQPFASLSHVNQLVAHEVDNSFPSDHTLLFFSICMMLFLGSTSNKRIIYLIAAVLVGLSRIWVGVHYPVDVAAGAAIGILASVLLYPLVIRSKMLTAVIQKYNRLSGSSGNTQI
ncbi:undecaprenyl-diphosphatase [Bacillus massiliglaciei]|uniref:undecaprenyl-diphosphatase n=1 Tax=Bacillus massiliglaciei TaxID=1816693 RepID=UPI000B100CCA|nr:undecaprenyl-diphosphatase [Bacillus massiliglaciei]